MKKNTAGRWILASLSLQFLLYLPLYVTRSGEGNFWPSLENLPESIIARANPDFFRWCLEFALLFSLSIFIVVKKRLNWVSIVLASIYLFLLVFQTYYYLLWKIYGEIPIFSNDFALFKRVLPVFMKTMRIPAFFFYILLISLTILIWKLLLALFQRILKNSLNYSLVFKIVFSTFYFLLPLIINRTLSHSPVDTLQSKKSIVWVSQNIYQTFTSSRIHRLPEKLNYTAYSAYDSLRIKSKPNILLVFIEAYGSVLGTVSPYDSLYYKTLKTIESELYIKEWKSASTLSNSTILGGRSWLGFTSLISGIRVDNHPTYEKLITSYPNYPHLIHFLNKQGYQTYRLNTMANFKNNDYVKIDSIAQNYFHTNHWTKYSDIPYHGYKYDYFGGIPDQFALNFWDETVLDKSKDPHFLFFITLNTHAPFYLPPPILENWKDLDKILSSPHKGSRLEKGKPIARYAQEVDYILHVLKKFILEKVSDNTLVILVGDHQPAGMEYMLQDKTDVYATVLHIIVKDPEWINLLISNGFDKGMVPELKKNSLLNHEGFYSFFMNIWAQKDSSPSIPPIFPSGINSLIQQK